MPCQAGPADHRVDEVTVAVAAEDQDSHLEMVREDSVTVVTAAETEAAMTMLFFGGKTLWLPFLSFASFWMLCSGHFALNFC